MSKKVKTEGIKLRCGKPKKKKNYKTITWDF